MEIANQAQGSDHDDCDDVSDERPGNYLRKRRNLQLNHNKLKQTKNTNHAHTQSLTLNTGQYNNTQIPKPSQRPRSPKNSHNRMSEGIFILIFILLFITFYIFLFFVFFSPQCTAFSMHERFSYFFFVSGKSLFVQLTILVK